MIIRKPLIRIVSIAVLIVVGIISLGYSTQAAFDQPEKRQFANHTGELESTAEAAYMVKEINLAGGIVSAGDSNFGNIGFNGQYLFKADDNTHGTELWKSDGTALGTEMVKDIYTGDIGSYPGNLVPFNNAIYFRAASDEYDSELWRSDGTSTGTVLIKDIHPEYGSYPNHLTEFNGYLYFSATDDEHGNELWRSDGTEAGTELFNDINLTGDSHPRSITPFEDQFFFTADDGINGRALWISDGTAGGTKMVTQKIPAFDQVDHLTIHDGALYLIAMENSLYDALWKSDGTDIGTEKIIDIGVVKEEFFRGNAWLQSVGDFLFFCNFTESHGYEYWISDGSTSGTQLLKDINPGTNSGCYRYEDAEVGFHNGEYFLSGFDSLHQRELWKSDGTEPGTKMVKNINPFGNGTAEGFYPEEFISLNELIFSADDGAFGEELWKTDGTDLGTVRMQDIASGSNPSDPKGMIHIGDNIFFIAIDNVHDYELWVLPLISMSDVDLLGETEGELGVVYSFDADVSPSNALTPVTYMWTATDLGDVRHIASLSDTVSFKWDSPGSKSIKVTASSVVNSVTSEMTIDMSSQQVAIGSLTLTGVSEGGLGTTYSFSAMVSPTNATTPITYEWQATGQAPQVNTGGLSDTVQFTWSLPGLKTITVSANNGVNILIDNFEINVTATIQDIFLPLILDNTN